MITSALEWLDHRAGLKQLVAMMLLEGVPGGAKWRYVWGSCLAFVFSIQLITGVMLMTAYSPSSSQAWNSVHFIQYQMDFGWLIRGLHHFGSQTMMVLIGLHMLQVVIAGAHLPPREINWWSGIGLFSVTFGLGLTGYLLPWDQKGYWATRVATNISNNVPVIGPTIRQLLVGGEDYGSHTLTRFYGLHVAVLPGSLILLLIFHIYVFRRHGVTSQQNVEGLVNKPANEHSAGTECFWPRQAFYDMIACMAVFGVMMTLVLSGHAPSVEDPALKTDEPRGFYAHWAKAGQRGLGAELDAAADRDTSNYPARPEWYFLFLFQLLKYFEGDYILVGTVHIPNGIMLILTILPLLGYGSMRKFGHRFSIFFMLALFLMVGVLTLLALRDDNPNGILWGMLKNTDPKAIEKAEKFQHSVHDAEAKAKRACQLAMHGTPVEGGHFLIRNDPLTTGRLLFERNCGSCHGYAGRDPKIKPSASDLTDFGSEKWTRGLLKDSMTDAYFGLVKKDGKHTMTGMRGSRKKIDSTREADNWGPDKIAAQEKDFDKIAAWLADQRKPKKERDKDLEKEGQIAFMNKQNKCLSCHSHSIAKDGGDNAPELTGYGSADWIRAMIMRPGHKSRYGENNQMPAFRNLDGPGSELSLLEFRETNPGMPESQIMNLSDIDRELIIRFMLGDEYALFGGTPISSNAPKKDH